MPVYFFPLFVLEAGEGLCGCVCEEGGYYLVIDHGEIQDDPAQANRRQGQIVRWDAELVELNAATLCWVD